MLLPFLLATALLPISLATAGTATLSNRCPYSIWLWSVDALHSSPAIHLAPRSQHSEPLRTTGTGAGTSFKISKTPSLAPGTHTQFEYSIHASTLWYDLSLVDCAHGTSATSCPGHAEGLAIYSPNQACARVHCASASYCPTQAYFVDTPVQKLGLPEPVFSCPGAGVDLDLYMVMCADAAPLKRSLAGRVWADREG